MRYVNQAAEALLTILFSAMLIVGTLQVFNRFFINASLSWSEELQRYAFIWLVFIAIPVAYNRSAHLRVDSIVGLLPKRIQNLLALVVDLLWINLGISLSLLTWRIMQVTKFQQSPGLEISMSWAYCGMLVGGVYLILCVVHRRLFEKTTEEPA